MADIDVAILCGKNSEAYCDFLIWSMQKTASNFAAFRFIFGLSDCENPTHFSKYAPRINSVVVNMAPQLAAIEQGSPRHAAGLNIMFDAMTAPVGMFLDCDLAFLRPGWDEVFLTILAEERTAILGTEYDSRARLKYMNFPNAIACMFKTEVLRGLNIRFDSKERVIVSDEALAKLLDVPMGEEIILDVGFELPIKIKSAGLQGIPLRLLGPAWPGAKFMKDDMRGAEYQWEGVPYVTHLGRSYTRVFGVDEHARRWEAEVRKWLGNKSS